LITSGVSSTPAITAAMLAELAPEFRRIEEILAHLRPLGIWCARGDESGWETSPGSDQSLAEEPDCLITAAGGTLIG
jgi:hypothetical protein